MTDTEPTAVRTTEPAQSIVPTPRPAPRQEERPRRRHDGYYWDVRSAAWRPCSGS